MASQLRMHLANYGSYYLAMYNRCLLILLSGINTHELPRWGQPFLHNAINGHVEVEQAPFSPAIAGAIRPFC